MSVGPQRDEWLSHLGRLRPWEVGEASSEVANFDRDQVRSIIGEMVDVVIRALPGRPAPADIDTIMLIAADISGVFRGNAHAKELIFAQPQRSAAWRLVRGALEGWSYDELVETARVEKEKENEKARLARVRARRGIPIAKAGAAKAKRRPEGSAEKAKRHRPKRVTNRAKSPPRQAGKSGS